MYGGPVTSVLLFNFFFSPGCTWVPKEGWAGSNVSLVFFLHLGPVTSSCPLYGKRLPFLCWLLFLKISWHLPLNLISLASSWSLPLFCILAETYWKETVSLPIAVTPVVEISSHASRVKGKLEAFLIQGKLMGKLQIPPQRKCRDTCRDNSIFWTFKTNRHHLSSQQHSSCDLTKAMLLFCLE